MKSKDQKNQKLYNQILQSYCDVCFGYFRKIPAKKIDQGLQILICSKCNCKTHKCCYDMSANTTFINDKIRQFVCDKCEKTSLKNKECFICHQTEGAMIVSEDGEILHIFCALYHNEIDIISYYPKIKVQIGSNYTQSFNKCDICKKMNAFQSCAFDNCKKSAHPYCVKKIYAKQQQQNEETKCWSNHLSCVNNNIFDLSDEIIPYTLFKQTLEEEMKEIESLNTYEIDNKEKIMKQKYNQYLDKAKKAKKSSKNIKRGGYLFCTCPQHSHIPYCICQNNGQGDMIECQSCFTWYHMSCIKHTPKNQQTFCCNFCKSFYDLKKKIIDEVVNGKNQSFELKFQLPVKMNFMDVMWIIRVIDSRISKGNIAKMLKQLVKYPLRTSKMEKLVKIQNKQKLQVLCEGFYLEYFFGEQQLKYFKPFPVLGLDQENRPLKLVENIQKNQKLRKLIVEIRNFCKRQGIVDEFKGILSQLDFKENAISDSYEKIIELSKSQQKYQEIKILKIKAQAYSFLQIVKKVNSGQIIKINQLQQSVRKANLIQNVPEYLILPLTEKYEKVQIILNKLLFAIQNDPYNLNQIKQISYKLTNQFKIEPPIFYQLYIQQRNFVNFLYFYYVKQVGKQIQGQISLKNKLQQLIKSSAQQFFECNQETIKNLNNLLQLKNKTNNKKFAFQQLRIIVQNLQKKTIKSELKDINNKSFKKQRLQYLFQKIILYQIQDPKIQYLINKYKQINSLFNEVVQKSLENVKDPIQMNQIITKCGLLISLLDNYPLKIESLKNNKYISWINLTKHRKQQITQLLILANQNQLEKNPLSLNKILDTLPRQNILVKKFKELKKEYTQLHSIFVNCFAKISQKMEYFKGEGQKKTRREQITLNEQKPDLKRMNQILQTLSHSRVDFSKQIRQITKIINKSLNLSHSVEKYCKNKQDFEKCNNIDQLSQARKQIEQFRKKILIQTQISLSKQLIELYHCQIHNRMRSNLISGNFQLEKNTKLLKFAQEQRINTTSTYMKLKQKFEMKNQKNKQITLIKSIESKLKAEAQKQMDPIYKNLYNFRKTLSIPDVEQQAPKISYIEEHKQKNRQLKQKITKVLAQGNHTQIKISLEQAKVILLQSLKNPYSLNNLSTFFHEIQKCSNFYNLWKRNNSLNKNILYNQQKFKDYQKLKFKVDQLQNSIKQIYKIKNCIKIIETIEIIIEQTNDNDRILQNCIMMQESIQQIQDNQLAIDDNEMLLLAKKKYIKIWYNFIKQMKYKYDRHEQEAIQQSQKSQFKVNMKKIRKLLYDSYNLLQLQLKSSSNNQQNIQELKQIILFFQQFLLQIKFNYLQSNYNKKINLINQWIDIDDLIYQIKVGSTLQEQFYLFKPFQDLSKFRYRNLNHKNFDIIIPKNNNIKEQNSFKRNRPDEFNYDIKQQKLTKKLSHVSKKQQQDNQKNINSNIVTQNSRKKIKDILSKNILKNQQLKKYGSFQNQIKMIENQIFGQYHNDMIKYLQTSEKFQKLFIKLQQCPQLSKKLIKKEFQFKFIKLLIQSLSKISQIQTMMVNKLKQQKNIQQFKNSLQSNNLIKGQKIQEQNNKNVLDMLASGKIDESYKKQLVKQVKKIKEAKDKKKKKSKHHRRSRSRSPSPDAKFSSESQEQKLPQYIQKQYHSQSNRNLFQTNLDVLPIFPKNEIQPLMFDPQMGQNQIQNMEKKFPRGSVLKIKTFNLEYLLKNKGKLQMKANLYTLEDYKKVYSQLVDPGFTSLNIRKQKNDKQILDYLSKPSKKKYKFIISWIQGQDYEQNQNLKQLSEQANQRHKIFGWQNQHIKVHVMSIKQFVQITRFSSNIPNRTTSKQYQEMFDTQRMICVIQYPAEKMYELKQKFKNFSDIQRVDQTFQVSIPLPSYDTYQAIQPQIFNPPNMNDILTSNTLNNAMSIKPMIFQDPLIAKQPKSIQFQGWASSTSTFQMMQSQNNYMGNINLNSDPYEQIRIKMGFGSFSPIMTDEEDNLIGQKEQKIDFADSLLKTIEAKGKIDITAGHTVPSMSYSNQQYQVSGQFGIGKYNNYQQSYQPPQSKIYPLSSHSHLSNPMMQNPISGMGRPSLHNTNNPMNFQSQNRGYNNNRNQQYNMGGNANRYGHHQGNYGQGHNNYSQNQYQQQGNMRNQSGNSMNYNQNRNRNPMFNPMQNKGYMPQGNNPSIMQGGYPQSMGYNNQGHNNNPTYGSNNYSHGQGNNYQQ